MAESKHGEAAGEIRRRTPQNAPAASDADIDPNAVYALGSSPGESARLQRQADELAPDSSALLDRVGPCAGDSAIDLGCGPRGIIELLAERVSPGGRVVGLDGDSAHVAMASELVARRALSGVEIVTADARHTGLQSGSFDLVHARTLLITLPEPADVLAEMVRLARPGGWVAGLEPDTEAAICYPPHPAFERMSRTVTEVPHRPGHPPNRCNTHLVLIDRLLGCARIATVARHLRPQRPSVAPAGATAGIPIRPWR